MAGSTPSRNGVPYTTSSTLLGKSSGDIATGTAISIGETGGGLQNFVRFLENWEGVPIKIAGGFIQNTRSRFATAPFTPSSLSSGTSDTTSVFMNPVQPGTGTTNGLVPSGYNLQYMSRTGGRIPYYSPPIRLWGYDVGLLTQPPDRFTERFAVPIPGANEFFREISGDDPWVEALLCALEPTTPTALSANTSTVNPGLAQSLGTDPKNYLRRALRGSDRRSACDTTRYGAAAPSDTISGSVYQ